jgi:DNA-binding transcriptional regulator GbsR (MarR family)
VAGARPRIATSFQELQYNNITFKCFKPKGKLKTLSDELNNFSQIFLQFLYELKYRGSCLLLYREIGS